MLNKVIHACADRSMLFQDDPETLADAEECYSQIVTNALRDVPGPSGKKFIEAYMMSRVRNECVLTVFLR
jgi:hypothetical protein